MSPDAIVTLIGTALIVAIPSTFTAVMARTNRRKIDATHDAVKVMNGNEPDDGEPLGDYLHRRMHTLDGRFDVMIGLLRKIEQDLDELVKGQR